MTGGGRSWLGGVIVPYLFLAPFLLLFVAFLVAPLAYALYISMFRDTLVGGRTFSGFANYVRAVGDAKLWHGITNLLLFGIMQVPVMLGIALVFALVLDRGVVYGKSVFRLGFFIPYAVPNVIAALLWGYLYGPAFGPFTQIAQAVGLPSPQFLSDRWMLVSLANIVSWEFVGYNMLIYYVGAEGDPVRTPRSGGDRRRQLLAICVAGAAAAAMAGDPSHHHLLDQRNAAALQ